MRIHTLIIKVLCFRSSAPGPASESKAFLKKWISEMYMIKIKDVSWLQDYPGSMERSKYNRFIENRRDGRCDWILTIFTVVVSGLSRRKCERDHITHFH